MLPDESSRARDARTTPGVKPAGQPFDERRVAAWIGRAITLRGDVICSQDLTIDGVVEGTIEVGQHSLIIGVGASIKADLVGRIVTIGGSITGNVTATEKVDLKATGSVEGDIHTPRIAMAEGAVVRGHVETGNKATPRS
jgi:cytoskeletal protein CcmA (bactofilin family)